MRKFYEVDLQTSSKWSDLFYHVKCKKKSNIGTIIKLFLMRLIYMYLLAHVNLFDLLAYRNDEMMMKTISFLFFSQYSLRYLEAIWIIYFLFCYFLLVFFSLTFSYNFLCRCLILVFVAQRPYK
jgi:hypothetical protein